MEQPSAARMVTDFSLSVFTESGWRETHHIRDNQDRLVVLKTDVAIASAVKITVFKALGDRIAVIPEIRIY